MTSKPTVIFRWNQDLVSVTPGCEDKQTNKHKKNINVICQEIYLWCTSCYCNLSGYCLASSKKVIYFFEPKQKRPFFQGALIPVTVPRMGHLIKNGIRAFPVPWLVSRVKQPCTLWETFHISWYYYPQDHIYAVCRVPPHPDLLAWFSSLFAYFHLYCVSVVSFSCTASTCKALNIPCMYWFFCFFLSDSEASITSHYAGIYFFYCPQHSPSSKVNIVFPDTGSSSIVEICK